MAADIFATFRALVGKKSYQSDSDATPRAGRGGQLMVDPLNALYYQAAKEILGDKYHDFYNDYAYNIRPASDDRPYFFDFFKLRSLGRLRQTLGRDWLPFAEWGYLVLIAALAQAACASAVLIVAPLGLLKREGAARGGRAATLVYFSMLGLAYIFLEMGFIQKLTLIIGDPVTAVAVTLAGFLAFSGLGSLSVEYLFSNPRKAIVVAVSAIVGVGLGELFLLHYGFDFFVGLGRGTKIFVGLATIAPLAFFMGMPFPTALRHLDLGSKTLVPWAWAVNGFASVTGAVLATCLAISFGFTTVAAAALGCYIIAALLYTHLPQAPRPE